MARSGRPKSLGAKASAAKIPIVNDSAPRETAAPERGDDCRDALLSMPEVSALDFTAQITVWALRSWVQAFKSSQSFDDVTHRTFARFGLTRSALAIDGLMTVLAASASRSIDIRCVPCRLLSPDEALVIDAMAAAQSGGYFVATVALRQLMPGSAARAALPHLMDLARAFSAAGMVAKPIPPCAGLADPAGASAEMPASTTRVLH